MLQRWLHQQNFMDKFSRPLAALLQRWLCQHKFRPLRVQQQRVHPIVSHPSELNLGVRQHKFPDKLSRPLAALLQRWLCQHKFHLLRLHQHRSCWPLAAWLRVQW